MVQANRALAFNTGDKFVPTTLDEAKGQVHPESCTARSPVVRRATGTLDMLRGASHRPDTWQVPVFYSEKVALSDAKGGTRYPFFFRKEDLDQARVSSCTSFALADGCSSAVPHSIVLDQAYAEILKGEGDETGGKSGEAAGGGGKRRSGGGGESGGLPSGLVRVATLDGVVSQAHISSPPASAPTPGTEAL